MGGDLPFFSLLLAFLALAGCGGPKTEPTTAAKPEPAVPVTVAAVKREPLQRTLTATGTLNAFDDVLLTPKVDGKVIAIHADAADRLAPGAPLLELDPTDYRLAVAEARAALLAELAPLGRDTLPPGPLTAKEMDAVPAVELAEVARLNADRKYRLWKNSGTSSSAEMLGPELELKTAEANKRVAVSGAESRLATARLRKAMLESAEQRLADTTLRVPEPQLRTGLSAAAPGLPLPPVRYAVAQRMAGVGEMIRTMPTTNVFRLVLDSTLKLRAALPEQHMPDVLPGQAVDVSVVAYPTAFAGRVSRVNPTVDPATRTFQVEIEVPNADGKLKAGGFARAAVRIRTDTVTVVPNAALVTFAGVNKVFVADGGKAKAVVVTLGAREKEWTEVTGELPAGASVITSGFSQLYDGSPIRVRAEKQN